MISQPHTVTVAWCFCLTCIIGLMIAPVYAFTSNSLDITVDKNGDAVAAFTFTLEGVIENAIPQSMLQEELTKGLTTSSEPPVILSFDKSGASLLMKNFAVINDVPTGTEYQTASMDFKKAEIALQNSALSTVISADFSPKKIVVTFPDGYTKELSDSSVLPSLKHTVIDRTKKSATAANSALGSISVNSSPANALVYIDSVYAGNTPSIFSDITPGQHQILLEMDDFEPLTKTVDVQKGETTMVHEVLSYVTPTPTPKKSGSSSGWILSCLGLVCCAYFFLRRT